MRRAASQAFASCAASRRVPERHDGVADVLVDRALAVDDGVGQRRQEPVHQVGQALRVVLVLLGDRGEAAHVREQHRHDPLLAAEHELLGRLGELLDEHRREVLPEGRADLAPLRMGAQVVGEDEGEVDERAGDQRERRIDKQIALREVVPGHAGEERRHRAADPEQGPGAKQRRERDDREPDQRRDGELGECRVARRAQHRLAEHAFEELGVDLDARHRRLGRRRLEVEEPDRGGADQDQPAAKAVGVGPAVEHVLGRDEAAPVVMREMHP
jgi:hypothetical protein